VKRLLMVSAFLVVLSGCGLGMGRDVRAYNTCLARHRFRLTLRWREMDSNHRYWKISHRFETDFCRLHDGSRSRKGFTSFATGDRQFESTSLQRGVRREPHSSREKAWAGPRRMAFSLSNSSHLTAR
jgi:hypothetical protein